MQQSNIKLPKFISILLILFIPTIGYLQRWNLYDYWQLRGYSPPAKVITLADESSVSDSGRRLFYVNKPSLDTKEEFRTHCTSGEQTIVLGCFVPFRGIYMQDINDERLTGVMQVTAAHEMLHAAYQRLSGAEKEKIGSLLEARFSTLNNERINNTIEDYKKNGADITNELHSILATEVRELQPELEEYYKKYFIDRSKVVAFSEQYEAAFTSRKNQVAEYDKQLESLKQRIDSDLATLENMKGQLAAKQAELDRYEKNNQIDKYNAAVPGYNNLVQSYNNIVQRVHGLEQSYNAIVKIRNDIALEENELVKAIDSRATEVPTE